MIISSGMLLSLSQIYSSHGSGVIRYKLEHELGPIGGNNAVIQKFGHEHFSHWGGHFIRVIYSVATHGKRVQLGSAF